MGTQIGVNRESAGSVSTNGGWGNTLMVSNTNRFYCLQALAGWLIRINRTTEDSEKQRVDSEMQLGCQS